MSQTTPNHHDGQATGPPPSFGQAAGPVDVEQAESVAAWLGWHAAELVGVGVPLALALVSAWFVVLAVPAAGLWAVQETRRARIRSGGRAALTSPDATSGRDEENDER